MAFGNEVKRPGDYYAPFYTVRFLVPNKDTVLDAETGDPIDTTGRNPKETLSSEDSDQSSATSKTHYEESEDGKILRAFVTSLIIEGVSSSAYQATVTLNPPYDDAVKILDNKLIRFGSIMEIQWGYRGAGGESLESPVHLFRITQPSVQFGQDTTITIVGRDVYTVTAENRKIAKSWKRSDYKTDRSLLDGILKELGTGYTVDDSGVPKTSTLFSAGEGEGYEQKESYSRFFKRICDKHNLGWIIAEGRKLKLFDEDQIASQSPAYFLRWRQPLTGSETPELPIEEISINPLLTLFQGLPAAKRVHVSQTSLDSNSTSQNKEDDTNQESSQRPGDSRRSGAGPQPAPPAGVQTRDGNVVPDPKMPDGATGDHHTSSGREPYQKGRTKKEITRTSQLTNTTASVKVPGHPYIHPQMIVEITGLPKIFAGRYLIRKARHILGTGYTVELDLYSRVVTQDQKDGAGQVAEGNVNQTKAGDSTGVEPQAYDQDGKPVTNSLSFI